jgi:hypothetical protein
MFRLDLGGTNKKDRAVLAEQPNRCLVGIAMNDDVKETGKC